jgi:hypothetical protein
MQGNLIGLEGKAPGIFPKSAPANLSKVKIKKNHILKKLGNDK